MDHHSGHPMSHSSQAESKFVKDPFVNNPIANPGLGQPESKFVRDSNIVPNIHPNPFINAAHESKTVQEAPIKQKAICCVCKETKFMRDECIRNNGMEKCATEISLHNDCLRKEGFNV